MTSPYIEEAARRAAAVPSHTPGPWSYDRTNGLVTANEVRDWPAKATVSVPVAQTYRAANARLIASAPDLLAALQGLCDWGREHTSPRDANSPHTLLIAGMAAIAKATNP